MGGGEEHQGPQPDDGRGEDVPSVRDDVHQGDERRGVGARVGNLRGPRQGRIDPRGGVAVEQPGGEGRDARADDDGRLHLHQAVGDGDGLPGAAEERGASPERSAALPSQAPPRRPASSAFS